MGDQPEEAHSRPRPSSLPQFSANSVAQIPGKFSAGLPSLVLLSGRCHPLTAIFEG